MNSDLDGEISRNIKTRSAFADAPGPSRIEDIGARLVTLNREHDDLDCSAIGIPGDENAEDFEAKRLLKDQVSHAMEKICDDMEVLTQALAMEQPRSAKELLICLLHILSPIQEAIAGIEEDARYEKDNGKAVYRMLRNMIPGLEALAGVTREELGCVGHYYQDWDTNEALIAKARKMASAQEATS
jgi:hypothetical protein